jgi:putative FmdB family regulatory protein
MPLYEYECERCGKHFELIQKFSDQPLTTHDECGGTVHRLLSVSALQFKGSGWYVNDYAKSSKPESSDNSSKKTDAAPSATSSSESSGTASSTASSPEKKTTSSDTKKE